MKNTSEQALDVEAFYDRISRFYDVTFKFNRYGNSLEQYLNDHLPVLPDNPRILDAGCGPGLMSEALLKTVGSQSRIVGLDLSAKSIKVARRTTAGDDDSISNIQFIQANLLNMPFHDETFDLVVTSGALEYVSLQMGLSEIARVLAPGGYLIYLPLRPTLAGYFLAISFRAKVYLPDEVFEAVSSRFNIISEHLFKASEPIGWSKTAMLCRKL